MKNIHLFISFVLAVLTMQFATIQQFPLFIGFITAITIMLIIIGGYINNKSEN